MYLRNVSSDALVLRLCCEWALEVHNRTSQWCDERWLVRIRDVDWSEFWHSRPGLLSRGWAKKGLVRILTLKTGQNSDTQDPGYFPGGDPKKETTGVFPMDMSSTSSVYSGRTAFELLYQMCITTVLWLSKRLLNVYIIFMVITHMIHMSNNTDTKSSIVARVCILWKQYRC
jgi:hypothetical protein